MLKLSDEGVVCMIARGNGIHGRRYSNVPLLSAGNRLAPVRFEKRPIISPCSGSSTQD